MSSEQSRPQKGAQIRPDAEAPGQLACLPAPSVQARVVPGLTCALVRNAQADASSSDLPFLLRPNGELGRQLKLSARATVAVLYEIVTAP